MDILHLRDSAMVGQGIVSLGGFLTMCRVRVSRPHLKPQVLFRRVQEPHSLHWPTSQPSEGQREMERKRGRVRGIERERERRVERQGAMGGWGGHERVPTTRTLHGGYPALHNGDLKSLLFKLGCKSEAVCSFSDVFMSNT